jgi:hypothetical protein
MALPAGWGQSLPSRRATREEPKNTAIRDAARAPRPDPARLARQAPREVLEPDLPIVDPQVGPPGQQLSLRGLLADVYRADGPQELKALGEAEPGLIPPEIGTMPPVFWMGRPGCSSPGAFAAASHTRVAPCRGGGQCLRSRWAWTVRSVRACASSPYHTAAPGAARAGVRGRWVR